MGKFVPMFMIAVSAALWGVIAIFVRGLTDAGFSPMEIVTIRVVTAAGLLGLIGAIRYQKQLRIQLTDSKLFIGTGIFSIVLFNWCYFTAINQMNLSIAVVLLYTAPAFVVILSFLFLKEEMNRKKLISVIGTVAGCILIAGIGSNEAGAISPSGVIIGLGAGFGYALYSIFGKFALEKYSPFTVTFYTFVTASFVLLPLTGLWHKTEVILSGNVLFYGIGLGLFPTVMAYLFYTKGLEKIESSKAAIIATVEPVVATLLSVLFYKESFGGYQLIGAIMILFSVIYINLPKTSYKIKGRLDF
nr:DMT family transporter [Neobacillus sp. Marseille-Q6967]